MRTEEIKVFQFNELSDSAKETARDRYRRFALDYDWWEHVYEDAERCGLKITGFDTDRHNISGHKEGTCLDIVEAIVKNHGKDCETFKLAEIYSEKIAPLEKQLEALESDDDSLQSDIRKLGDKIIDAEKKFIHDILEEYLSMLRKECDYLLSDESIDEMIQCNEYEFTEDGSRWH
jgi:hypothetical protein